MKTKISIFAILVSSFFVHLQGEGFESLRDPDVLYFEGKQSEFPTQKIEKLTPLFTDKDLRSLIQNLVPSSKVRVIGWHDQGWLVQSADSNTTFEGWVGPDVIRVVSLEMLQKLRENVERNKTMKGAIAEKKVIPGMSLEEVKKSLGKPQKTTFREDEKGKTETWSYIRYENVPELRWGRDLYGNMIQSMVYIRVPKGENKVEFKDGKVVAYEESK